MKQTLQAVQEQFTIWRKNKSYRQEAIPDHLWKAAIALVSRYSKAEIIKTLRLNHGDFCQRLHGQSNTKKLTPPVPQFIELAGLRNPAPAFSALPCQRLELERPDGCRLRLYATETQVLNGQEIIQEFLKGSHASGHSTNQDFSSRSTG